MDPNDQVNAVFETGVRAARTGNLDAAERLFTQVVAYAPRHELAWLWLAKVSQDPASREAALKQALELNPGNQWAGDQLAVLERGESMAGAEPPPSQAEVLDDRARLRAEGISCPNCGGSVKLRLEDSKTVVCQFCDSIVDLTPEQAAVVGKRKPLKAAMPIELGATGTFGGQAFTVIGWLRFKGFDSEDTWHWDEWLLVAADGTVRWLSYDDEDGFGLAVPIPIEQGFDADIDSSIPVEGKHATVHEREGARIVALNGELTWKAQLGEHFRYLEARAGKTHYSVEWSRHEIEMFRGEELTHAAVAQAFGVDLPKRSRLRLSGSSAKPPPGVGLADALVDGDEADLGEMVLGRSEDRPATAGTVFFAGLCALAALALAAIGAYAFFSGTAVGEQQLDVVKNDWRMMDPVPVKKAGRPARLDLRCQSLPTNTWVVVEVEAKSAAMTQWAYVGSAQFWDEEGRDSDGHWHESDLTAKVILRPLEAGQYAFRFRVEEAKGVSGAGVTVKLREGVLLARWWFAAAAIAALLYVGAQKWS